MFPALPLISSALAPAAAGASSTGLASAFMGGASSLIGGLLGKSGVKDQNISNAKQAQLNRDFQERMSSTAHQRNIADLRAAGLNPILSATKGGSSTPGGAQAQMQNELEPLSNSARQTAQIASQMKLIQAQTNQTNTMSNKTAQETANAQIQNKILADQSVSSALQAAQDQILLDSLNITKKGAKNVYGALTQSKKSVKKVRTKTKAKPLKQQTEKVIQDFFQKQSSKKRKRTKY